MSSELILNSVDNDDEPLFMYKVSFVIDTGNDSLTGGVSFIRIDDEDNEKQETRFELNRNELRMLAYFLKRCASQLNTE